MQGAFPGTTLPIVIAPTMNRAHTLRRLVARQYNRHNRNMSLTYRSQRRVEFRATDAAGIMHFSTFFNLMEEVEHEFLRHLQLSVLMTDAEGTISWPRVSAKCEYLAAAKFEDVLELELKITRLGKSSLAYQFDVRRENTPVARGEFVVVCCRIVPHQPPQSLPIPPHIRSQLEPFVAPVV